MLIRKNGFTEIVSFENGKVTHEMGDKIAKASVRNSIYTWIINNHDKLLEEYNLANSYSFEYQPKNF